MDSVTGMVRIWMLSKFWAEPSAGQTKSPRMADVVRLMITLSGSFEETAVIGVFPKARRRMPGRHPLLTHLGRSISPTRRRLDRFSSSHPSSWFFPR